MKKLFEIDFMHYSGRALRVYSLVLNLLVFLIAVVALSALGIYLVNKLVMA
ncbi:TPA: hypothetical protein ACPZVG_001461 [Klebsiella pneumoniae]